MLKSYLLIAWRTFNKNRLLTIINMLGLSIGITAAIVVYLVIDYNFSFDKYEPDRDLIYRVVTETPAWKNYGVSPPVYRELTNVSGINAIVPLFDFYGGNTKVAFPGSSRTLNDQGGIVFTSTDYFTLFPHQWIAGNAQACLGRANAAVLTQRRAEAWFPQVPFSEIIGKTVLLSDSVYVTVSGIVKDLEANSDFEYQTFLSLPTIPFNNLTGNYSWDKWSATSSGWQLLIRTDPGVKPASIDRQLASLTRAHLGIKDDSRLTRRLQPLNDIHTNTELSGKISKAAMGSLATLAVFLVLLGCINFINLSTAQGAQRAKEIGIRKTFGGSKRQLIFQFLTETFLLTTATSLIAFLLVSVAIRSFVPGDLQPDRILYLPSLGVFFVCLIVCLTLLSGLYPAFVLSGLQPVRVLKNLRVSWGSGSLRRVLTVSQFTIAQLFLIGVFVVNKQVHYSLQKDMGFRQHAVVTIPLSVSPGDSGIQKRLFCERVSKLSGVEAVSLGNQSPAFNGQTATRVTFSRNHKDMTLHTDLRTGDADYLDVYQIRVVAGRNIRTADSAEELLINETLARQMGFSRSADAVGHFLVLNDQPLPVVGVMADFNQASVRTGIQPLLFYSNFRQDHILHVALAGDAEHWKHTLAEIGTVWKTFYADEAFDYSFVDENIARLYRPDTALSLLLSFAAGIALLVSCIGLLGLTIFSINSRVKEIGIRKVLGASLFRLLSLLSTGFVRPLLLAFCIATPLAWLGGHLYLQNFAYHTSLPWWVFAASGSLMIVIAMATIGFHLLRAAIANPVDSLRTE